MCKQVRQFKSDNANSNIKHNKNSNKTHDHYYKQKLNAIISKSVKDALKNTCCHHCNEEEVNVIDQFKTLGARATVMIVITKTTTGPPEKGAVIQLTTLMYLMII
eukprot:3482408-Ditylum_brightwellii.AAC.1